jgi:hypothetical protein
LLLPLPTFVRFDLVIDDLEHTAAIATNGRWRIHEIGDELLCLGQLLKGIHLFTPRTQQRPKRKTCTGRLRPSQCSARQQERREGVSIVFANSITLTVICVPIEAAPLFVTGYRQSVDLASNSFVDGCALTLSLFDGALDL